MLVPNVLSLARIDSADSRMSQSHTIFLTLLLNSLSADLTGGFVTPSECFLVDSDVWRVYMSMSTRVLSEEEAVDDSLGDTVEDDEGIVCDPALFYFDRNLTRIHFMVGNENDLQEAGQTYSQNIAYHHMDNFSKILPDLYTPETTTFNVTCRRPVSDLLSHLTWSDSTRLQSLGLRCFLENLPRDFLFKLEDLLILDLSHNRLKSLPSGVFKKASRLRLLLLNFNPFVTLPSNLFCGLDMLYSLNMVGCLVEFPRKLFGGSSRNNRNICTLDYLELLRLQRNSFASIPANAFVKVSKLRDELILSDCGTPKVNRDAFRGLQYMEVFVMDRNDLKNQSLSFLGHLTSSRHIVLRNNSIPRIRLSDFRDLGISALFLSWNSIELIEGSFSNLRYIGALDLSHNNIEKLCRETFSRNNSALQLQFLNFSFNAINEIENQTFDDLDSLRTLDLSKNLLKSLSKEVFAGLVSLQHLFLDNNLLTHIDAEDILGSRSLPLELVSLYSNPWRCDCEAVSLYQWLMKYPHKMQFINQTTCSHPRERVDELMTAQDLVAKCTPNNPEVFKAATGSLGAFVTILSIISLLVLRYRLEIQVLAYAKYGIRFPGSAKKVATDDEHFPYDAFVSHSSSDEDFVRDELMPRLEDERQPPYRLCVHFRDFCPGQPIVENIARAIETSHRVIMVVSAAFLQSDWCKYEFQMAHHEVMSDNDRKGRVILVLMEALDTDKLDRHMKAYINTHTYLERRDKLFWERLIFALPDQKARGRLERRRLNSEAAEAVPLGPE